jgi:hypothetical protein
LWRSIAKAGAFTRSLPTLGHSERLTRAQKLAKALGECRKEPKRRRAKCEKQAHKEYGASGKKEGEQARKGKR